MQGFNQKFIDNWSVLSKSKVGLEFEFYGNSSYFKLLEKLNVFFSDTEKMIWGFNRYHSDFVPTDKEFKIEPDYSGGPDMIELVTGPMTYVEARVILIRMLQFIKLNGWTDNHCSIHVNISFDDNDLKIENLSPLKLIMTLNEEVIYNVFPSRRNNIYCQSVQWMIPFQDYPDPEVGINQIMSGLILPDDTKYYGVNLQKRHKGWLEWRYIGGKDYEFKQDSILELMDYFIMTTYNSFKPLVEEDTVKLFSFLDDNIAWYNQYNTYEDFLVNIDSFRIEYDGDGDIDTIRAWWSKIKDKLFDIIKRSKAGSINGGVFNWNSRDGRFEIVECDINDMFTVSDVSFIDCNVTNVTAFDCTFADCEVLTSHVWDSKIMGTKMDKCKVTNSEVTEFSELIDCMFDGKEIIESKMDGGVFRSGKIGEDCEITPRVKMSNKETFWSIYDPHNKKILVKK